MTADQIIQEAEKLGQQAQETAEIAQKYMDILTGNYETNVNAILSGWGGDNATKFMNKAQSTEEEAAEIIMELMKIANGMAASIQAWADEEVKKMKK